MVSGRCAETGKRQTQWLLMERQASINRGMHEPERVIAFGRFVLKTWEPNLLQPCTIQCGGNIGIAPGMLAAAIRQAEPFKDWASRGRTGGPSAS